MFQPNYNGYNYQPTNQYAFVTGPDGAKAYNIGPNQTMMLMDNNEPIVYMKTSNQLGQSTLRYFKLVETTEAEIKGSEDNKYALKSDFDDLKTKIQELIDKTKAGDNNA